MKKVTLLILLLVGSLLCVQAQRKKVTSAEVLFDVTY